MHPSITAVILAAGKGTRMKSSVAKVLHQALFRPMLYYVLDAVQGAGVARCAVVIGHQRREVEKILTPYAVTPVVQEEQQGTGHAVLCAEAACAGADEVLILCGDTPLITPQTLKAMIEAHHQNEADLTLMTTVVEQPFGYGRIIRDSQGGLHSIVEEKDASEAERRIREINAGIYLVKRDLLFSSLRQVGTDNAQGEVYLTDIVALARQEELRVLPFQHTSAIDVLGVNSRVELAQAQSILQERRNRELMQSGVTMECPATTLVAADSSIGPDTILQANTRIFGGSTLGKGCRVESGAVLNQCQLADRVIIGANAVLNGCRITEGTAIPPLSCLDEQQI